MLFLHSPISSTGSSSSSDNTSCCELSQYMYVSWQAPQALEQVSLYRLHVHLCVPHDCRHLQWMSSSKYSGAGVRLVITGRNIFSRLIHPHSPGRIVSCPIQIIIWRYVRAECSLHAAFVGGKRSGEMWAFDEVTRCTNFR